MNRKLTVISFKNLCLSFFVCLLSITSFSQEVIKSNEERVLDLIKYGRKQLELGNKVMAFDALVSAQNYSLILDDENLFYKASLELANFYILKNRMTDAREIFAMVHPSDKFSPEDNCRYFHRKAFFYNQLGTLDSARYCSLRALEIAEKNQLKGAFGTIYNELGNIYERNRVYDTSMYYYNLAVGQFDTNSMDYANAYYNIGRTFYEMHLWDSSIFYLQKVILKTEETDWSSIKSPTYNYLAENYLKLDDSTQVYKYKWFYTNEELKVMHQVHGKDLEKLEAEYGAARKKVEIQEQKNLLEAEKSEKQTLFNLIALLVVAVLLFFVLFFVIRNKNKRLNKLLSENEFLVGEANHRIKNNLQIIVSLVSREIYKKDDEEIDALRNIASKIDSIATLHQQMYINEEKSEIDLTHYLNTLAENLIPLCEMKKIELQLDSEDNILFSVSKSIYIGLLFNELIVNSIKHAFTPSEEGALIKVIIRKTKNSKIVFEFSDNGKGIELGQKPKLIDMMCRQLKCKYEVDGTNGFQFKMSLKND